MMMTKPSSPNTATTSSEETEATNMAKKNVSPENAVEALEQRLQVLGTTDTTAPKRETVAAPQVAAPGKGGKNALLVSF